MPHRAINYAEWYKYSNNKSIPGEFVDFEAWAGDNLYQQFKHKNNSITFIYFLINDLITKN